MSAITFSGRVVTPEKGTPALEDIAVSLCRITRYAGAIWWTVAAHSVLVAEIARDLARNADLDPAMAWLFGLLHDAAESVTGEIVNGFKTERARAIEEQLFGRIIFDVAPQYACACPKNMARVVKEADMLALRAEIHGIPLTLPTDYPAIPQTEPYAAALFQRIKASAFGFPSNALFTQDGATEAEEAKTFLGALRAIRAGDLERAQALIRGAI